MASNKTANREVGLGLTVGGLIEVLKEHDPDLRVTISRDEVQSPKALLSEDINVGIRRTLVLHTN